MTQLRLCIVSAVVLAGMATALVLQLSTQLRLCRENETLLQENNRLSQLAADNERLSKLVAQANQSLPTTVEPPRELLRLRGEVGVLRRQNEELAKMLLRNQAPASASGHDQGFEPSASWADAGNATPESAAQTFCWAIKTGSSARLAEVLLQPEHGDKTAAVFVSAVSQSLEPLLSQIEASRLLVTESPTPEETTYWFQNRLKGGETLISPLTLKRIGNEWKVKLSPGPQPENGR